MNQISNLFPKNWRNLHFIVLVFFSILLIFGGETINAPTSRIIINSFYYPFFKIKTFVAEMSTISAENDLLRQQLVKSRTRIAMLEKEARKNERLGPLQDFEPPEGYSLVPAKVISVNYDGSLPISAVINRGARDTIAVDQPVVNLSGLIGRIKEIMGDVSVVQLLTDPANRVAARIAETREMGIVKYESNKGLVLANFPVQGEIHEGDLIVSSGLGGVYAAGLTIGNVKRVVRRDDEPFCDVTLEPAARFGSLEELFVLRSSEQ
ncbi:MAG: rod shape-determining protein MreC [candidate division Zixibacteria bacterium]